MQPRKVANIPRKGRDGWENRSRFCTNFQKQSRESLKIIDFGKGKNGFVPVPGIYLVKINENDKNEGKGLGTIKGICYNFL